MAEEGSEPEVGAEVDSTPLGDEVLQPEEAQTDEVLLGSQELAREALVGIAPAGTVGDLVGSFAEADHVLSLFFASLLPGYPDWRWTVTLARVDEESAPTVLEVELLPGETSMVAPDWVPWSERLAEYELAQELAAATAAHPDDESDDDDLADEDDDELSDDELSDEDELDDDESDDDVLDDEDELDDVIDIDDHITDDDVLVAAAEADEAEPRD
ncbi:DUF3027 domain-containing protein [Herbiconiux liukaitaii]|uniref:DUF3027 domain-containing protein n=1 Tax=Herbiconiux liukaitaii TaxID=3342799 RepID=UPI0035B859A1